MSSKADTIRLLGECNAGIKMGVESINQVLPKISSRELHGVLEESRKTHESLGNETHRLLNELGEGSREPNVMAKGMSWIKTNVMMAMDDEDKTAAGLIIDGCAMGVKSLCGYLNEYSGADSDARSVAERLIDEEDQLGRRLRSWL